MEKISFVADVKGCASKLFFRIIKVEAAKLGRCQHTWTGCTTCLDTWKLDMDMTWLTLNSSVNTASAFVLFFYLTSQFYIFEKFCIIHNFGTVLSLDDKNLEPEAKPAENQCHCIVVDGNKTSGLFINYLIPFKMLLCIFDTSQNIISLVLSCSRCSFNLKLRIWLFWDKCLFFL